MFWPYVNDMKSWIFFFTMALAAADVLLWLDAGLAVELSSLLYMNALLLISLGVFVFWRYRRETAYSWKLARLEGEAAADWHELLPEAKFKRDEQMNEVLQAAAASMAAQLNELRQQNLIQGDYTAAWVHEAKAPLTAIRLLIDSNRSAPGMQRIEAEWLRLFLLIDQQLYISRLSSLEADYAVDNVVLKDVVAPEVRELMAWCREKQLEIELDGLDITVMSDKKWVRFVLRQILSNAVKYSPEGGTIHISARTDSTGHRILTVQDEGPGIPDHDLPRIFDKGFTGGTGRLHNAATGLGLYLAKTVSDKIGITLSADSRTGHGTTMEMAFPLENDFDHIRK
ncbi:MAG: sensor histidine kinase [Bacillota bacterium]